ncbi:hypothetical protein BRC63_02795 [Halobacteriales archaeon QH_10_70_21]|nr:MAG: hypothetical protein BRC63_02795 [Halobacteriales archaeon QH_10_70_21]
MTAQLAFGVRSTNTGGQTLRRRHRVGRRAAGATPAETALPVDSLVESAKRVVETGSRGA